MGLATNMKRGPANESIQVAVVDSISGFGDKTDSLWPMVTEHSGPSPHY